MRIRVPGVGPGGNRDGQETNPRPPALFVATAFKRLWRTPGATFPIPKGFLEEVMGCKRKLGTVGWGKGEVGLGVCWKLWRAGKRLRRLRGSPGIASISG